MMRRPESTTHENDSILQEKTPSRANRGFLQYLEKGSTRERALGASPSDEAVPLALVPVDIFPQESGYQNRLWVPFHDYAGFLTACYSSTLSNTNGKSQANFGDWNGLRHFWNLPRHSPHSSTCPRALEHPTAPL